MARYSVGRSAGRLVEGRVLDLRTREDGARYRAEFADAITSRPGQVIVLADYRAVAIFPPDVTDELKGLMLDMNARILRSAILVAPDHATNALQVDRVVRETHNPSRQRFTDPAVLLRWLSEAATPAEMARAAEFLAGR